MRRPANQNPRAFLRKLKAYPFNAALTMTKETERLLKAADRARDRWNNTPSAGSLTIREHQYRAAMAGEDYKHSACY